MATEKLLFLLPIIFALISCGSPSKPETGVFSIDFTSYDYNDRLLDFQGRNNVSIVSAREGSEFLSVIMTLHNPGGNTNIDLDSFQVSLGNGDRVSPDFAQIYPKNQSDQAPLLDSRFPFTIAIPHGNTVLALNYTIDRVLPGPVKISLPGSRDFPLKFVIN